MAIIEPGCGSDSAAIRTTAVRNGEHYVLNGEKIFVTSGQRADTVAVWAALDKALGHAGHEGHPPGDEARDQGRGYRLDIFQGAQQIQLPTVARRLLGKAPAS